MSISFELGEPPTRTFYTSGSPVRGLANIVVSPHIINQLKSIDLIFSGRSEIQLRGQNPMSLPQYQGNGRTMFFETMTSLATFDAYHLAHPGGHTYAFDAKFPAVSTIDQLYREHPMSDSVLCKLPAQSGIPLPPTYRQNKTFKMNTGAGGVIYKGEVRVIYELEVQLTSIHGRILYRGAIQLRFLPQSFAPPPKMTFLRRDHNFEIRSAKLNVAPTTKTLKGWAKGVAAKTPVTYFKVFLDIPNYCTVGTNMAIYMGVDYDLDRSTANDIPSVYLVSFFMRITEVMRVGTADRMYSTDAQDQLCSVVEIKDQTHFTNITGEANVPNAHNKMELRKCKPILITERTDLRNHVTPDSFLVKEQSFESTNAHRCFQKCQVDVVIECAGKSMPATYHCHREVIMRPPDADPGVIELDHVEASRLPPEVSGGTEAQVFEMGGKATTFELQGQVRAELGSGMEAAQDDPDWKQRIQFEMHQGRGYKNPHPNPQQVYYELE